MTVTFKVQLFEDVGRTFCCEGFDTCVLPTCHVQIPTHLRGTFQQHGLLIVNSFRPMSDIGQHLFDVHRSALVGIKLRKKNLGVKVCQGLRGDRQIAPQALLELLEAEFVGVVDEDLIPRHIALCLGIDNQSACTSHNLLGILCTAHSCGAIRLRQRHPVNDPFAGLLLPEGRQVELLLSSAHLLIYIPSHVAILMHNLCEGLWLHHILREGRKGR
mmetsp:Transcript_3942/g.8537  ORF Transcript_3942/g.8537 Transcript_3942/m.8537 type:complete len:216 (-) Transcript_3942:74-721(-)